MVLLVYLFLGSFCSTPLISCDLPEPVGPITSVGYSIAISFFMK